ncbi:MAG: conjugal transfer protein TraN [Pseudomonadales bacterium]|nr:conjugal transfer protein TraN [Pseudomonadales bacterium]
MADSSVVMVYGLGISAALIFAGLVLRSVKKLIFIALGMAMVLFVGNHVFAADPNADGKAFAESMQGSVNNSATNANPEDVPHYEGQDVPETQYYNSGAGIEDQARIKAADDPTAEYISNSHYSRPQFDIDRENDPLFQRHEEISDKAYSLTDTYQGCVELPVGSGDTAGETTDTCNVIGYQEPVEFDCTLSQTGVCTNPLAGHPKEYEIDDFQISGAGGLSGKKLDARTFEFKTGNNSRSGNCKGFTNTIKFWVEDPSKVEQFELHRLVYDDSVDVSLNGHLVASAMGSNIKYNGTKLPHYEYVFLGLIKNCEFSNNFNKKPAKDIREHLIPGWNEIKILHTVGGAGNVNVIIKAMTLHPCEPEFSYSRSCPAGESPSIDGPVSKTCTSGPGTQLVQGFPVWQPCWEWQETYEKLSAPLFDRDIKCDQLEEDGCGVISSHCNDYGSGFCANQTLTYTCPGTVPDRTVLLCGEQLSCEDGNCTEEYKTKIDATEDFKRAATHSAVANEIASEFNFETVSVFKGDDKKCKKHDFGYADCCKDGGWGTDAGFSQCSTEEKELGVAKEADSTHYVGSYDSGSWPDERTYKVYCVYPSKLARIIVEQGNKLLGRGYGSAKHPVCRGFTLEELESLDFEQMDLSEFYEDVEQAAANGSVPNPAAVTAELKEKIEQMGGQ